MLAWYRDLIRLRREHPELREPVACVRFDEAAGWLIVERPHTLVAANLTDAARRLEVGAGAVLLASRLDVELGQEQLLLPANSVAVLERA